jgi:hypothetical protein
VKSTLTVLILAVILVLLSASSVANAQSSPTDSSGTATAYWQRVDVLKQGTKTIDIFNTGAVNLKYCLVATDTTAVTKTRYQATVDTVQRFVRLVTKSQYVYVKAASATCVYRVTAY